MLARRLQRIGLSPTLAVNDLARRLRAEGVDVLDFSAGQPDFPTPDAVKEAGKRAIDENRTRYTSTAGIEELRRAIAERIERDLGLRYATDEILVSPGAKASLYAACMALAGPGDEVLVPAPYWTSYPEQVRLAGAEPIAVHCREDRGFKLSGEQLRSAVTPRTKAVILNYPANPTGACYDRAELEELGEVCLQHDLWVIADEIYSKLLFDGRSFHSIAQLGREMRERTLLVDGMSKTYSMTGWRVGYAAGPRELISGMAKVQSHSTSHAASMAQWASLQALALDDRLLAERVRELERRRDEMLRRLRDLDGLACVRPDGAFYLFPNVAEYFTDAGPSGPLQNSEALCRYLLEQARVAAVPGEAFGSPEHIRLSFAVSVASIRTGMDRIAQALAALRARA